MRSTHSSMSRHPSSNRFGWTHRLPLPAVYQRRSYHWFVVGTVCIGAFMAAVDASIVNIALPLLQRYFHVGLSTITWISLVYLLTLASLIIPLGRIADLVGRRWMYAIGFSVFIIGSFLCGISTALSFLLVSRVVQAVGAAMLQANSVAIITAATPAHDRGKAIGIQGSAQAIGLSIGPAIGGTLLSFLSWRWIFFVNVPIGIVGTILGVLMLPPDRPPAVREHFDFAGAIALALPLVAMIYVLNTGGDLGWTSPAVIASCIVAVCGFTAFFIIERRTKNPMLDISLFRIPVIMMGSITGVLSFAVMYAVTLLGPFELDHLGALPSYTAGLYMMVIPLGMTVFTPVSGALADRFGTRLLTVLGMFVAIAGTVALAASVSLLHHNGGYVLLLAGFFLVGTGLGVFTPPNNSSVMASSPKHHLGVTGGILNMSRTMGMSIGVTLGGLFYRLFLAAHGAENEAAATSTQMSLAFQDAYLFIAVVGLLAFVLSMFRKRGSLVRHKSTLD